MPVSLSDYKKFTENPSLPDDTAIYHAESGALEAKNGLEQAKDELRSAGRRAQGYNAAVDTFIHALNKTYPGYWTAKHLTLSRLRMLEKRGQPLNVGQIRASIEELECSGSQLSTAPAKTQSKPPPGLLRNPPEASMVMVGGGTRTTAQVDADVNFILEHQDDFKAIKELKGTYGPVTTVVVDEQEMKNLGKGNAWGPTQSGMANTGPEFTHTRRLDRWYKAQQPDIEFEGRTHPLMAVSYSGYQAGRNKGAAAARSIIGKEETEHSKAQLARLEQAGLSDVYDLRILDKSRATKVNLPAGADPKHPSADISSIVERDDEPDDWEHFTAGLDKIKRNAADSPLQDHTVTGHSIRLNTGTTLMPPALNSGVHNHAYTDVMNSRLLSPRLQRRGLLDEQGKLKAGISILTGGSGLSLYDQLTALEPMMGLIETDPTAPMGYRISEAARQKYQGAITVTSNTPGKWIAPRHTHHPVWTQEVDALGNAAEQHALFLHSQGEQVFDAWQDIAEASCAAATGRVPADVRDEKLGTEELLQKYNQESERHWAALQNDSGAEEQTLYGARRQAYFSSTLGLGMERDIAKTVTDMGARAPHTFRGREGYLMHRAQLKGVTEPGTEVGNTQSKRLYGVLSTRMQDITASPPQIHALTHKLMEAGVLKYTAGKYEDIRVNPEQTGKPLSFTDHAGNNTEHDLFVVSKVFDRQANPVVRSLKGQVEPIALPPEAQWWDAHLATYGAIEKHRMLRAHDGSRTPVEDYGLSGKGVRVTKDAHLGAFAWDVNNRESASQIATGLAYRRFAQEALEAAGFDNPIGTVEELYEQLTPDDAAYATETASFQEAYQSAMEKSVYLKLIEQRAGKDPARYRELFEHGRTASGRETHGGAEYTAAVRTVPPYQPSAKADFYKRFADSPDWAHEQVYMKAQLLAAQRLLQRRQRAAGELNVVAGKTGAGEWHGSAVTGTAGAAKALDKHVGGGQKA